MSALVALLLAALAADAPDPLVVLAPAPADLAAAEAELQRRLVEAERLFRETAALQNAWVTGGGPSRRRCEQPADLALALEAQAKGEAWREAAQAARAQAARVEEMVAAPTLAPLLDETARATASAAAAAAEENARRYLESSAWQARWLAPLIARCR